MRAKYDAVDLMAFIKPSIPSYVGYWNEQDEYAVAPFGRLTPYCEGGKRCGYQFHIGGGSAGPNPFGEGAVAGSPGTFPTSWTRWNGALGVTARVAAVNTFAEGHGITIELSGAASDAGTLFQIDIGNLTSPATLPAAASGQNWTGEVHLRDENFFNGAGLTCSMHLPYYDAGGTTLGTATRTLTMPTLIPGPAPMQFCRLGMRSGSLPANTARIGQYLRFNTPAATGSLDGIQIRMTMPMIGNRANFGSLPGRYAMTGLLANGVTNTSVPLAELMRLPMWMNPEAGTFHVKFKGLPNVDTNTANARSIFGFGNYVGSNLIHVNTSTAASPNIILTSVAAGGNSSRTLKSAANISIWNAVTISYQRLAAGGATIISCWADETNPAFPVANTDTFVDLVPFLFGTIGMAGSAYLSARQYIGGALEFFDYYPYAMDINQVRGLTTASFST